MCAVSRISDYYTAPSQIKVWTAVQKEPDLQDQLKEIIKRLDELDKKLNDKECMDDKKKEFFEGIGYKSTDVDGSIKESE